MFVELGECSQNMLSEAFWTSNIDLVAVRRILRTILAKQKFAQLRTNYIRRMIPTMFANKCLHHANNLPSTEQAAKTQPKQDKSFSFIFHRFNRLSGV